MSGPEFRQHLVDEANASVSFANILATIGTVVAGYLLQQKQLNGFEVPILLSIVLIFFSFFASIFYANVTGIVRHKGEDQALVPMFYGNAITEYLGIYLLMLLLPLVVHAVTRELNFSLVCVAVTAASFLAYRLSGFDLLARCSISRFFRAMLSVIFVSLLCLNLLASEHGSLQERYIVAAVSVSFLFGLVAYDVSQMKRQSSFGSRMGLDP